MLFLTFAEKKACGGSDFLELQYCRLPAGASLAARVAVDAIGHWQEDSLYLSDAEAFFRDYQAVLGYGTYNNLQEGPADLCGINYYTPEQTAAIAEALCRNQPEDWQRMAAWLEGAKAHNGFYLLGL